MTDATLHTVTDTTAIAVNQDPLGEQGTLRLSGGYKPNKPRPTTNAAFGYQIWTGALSNHGAAAVLANLDGNASRKIPLPAAELPSSRQAVSKWDVVEAFTGATMPGITLPVSATVGPHDVAMWMLTPTAADVAGALADDAAVSTA